MEDNLDDIEVQGSTVEERHKRTFHGTLKEELDSRGQADTKRWSSKRSSRVRTVRNAASLWLSKHGRFGVFAACTGYPECKNTKPLVQSINVKCPEVRQGYSGKKKQERQSVLRMQRLSGMSRSHTGTSLIDRKCPECGELLVEKKSKGCSQYACSNSECELQRIEI